ncbi:MAG TPA: glycosyltransferase family 39 protein [Ktedonobacteraceae bacterium]|nr:glycosyltransferase family 39 protein [Ktedonobacteraceae bacterium]
MAKSGTGVVERVVVAQKTKTRQICWQRLVSAWRDVPLWGWCLVFFVVALGFDLYRLSGPSIWYDEAFSVELARQPLPLLWHIIWGPEPNMELYYLFLHFWLGFTALLGLHPVEWVVRLPSAIFAALSTVMVFLLGRRFLGLVSGMLAASLYLLNDLQLVYAQQARSYSMQLFLLCLTCYALFSALTVVTPVAQKRWWACFVAVVALAVYAHLFSLLVLCALLCALAVLLLLPNAWRASLRQRLPALLVSLACTFVLIIPMLLMIRHGAKTGWLPVPQLIDIYHLFVTMSGNSKRSFLLNAACCSVALGLLLWAYMRPESRWLKFVTGDEKAVVDAHKVNETGMRSSTGKSSLRHAIPFAFVLLCWLMVPVVLSFIISHGPTHLFSSRYLVVVVPPLCLLVACGVALLRWRVGKAVLIAVLLLVAISLVPQYYASAQVEDWHETTFWLEQHYRPDDGLVCYDNSLGGCQIPVQYYLDAYPDAAHFTANWPGAFSWQRYGSANPASGPEAAVNPADLVAFAAQHPRIFFIVGRVPDAAAAARAKAAQHWLDSHYHLIAQIVTRTVTIRLYATR